MTHVVEPEDFAIGGTEEGDVMAVEVEGAAFEAARIAPGLHQYALRA
jgi:hypothetical protein